MFNANKIAALSIAALTLAAGSTAAMADVSGNLATAVITADNHYALFTDAPDGSVVYIGGNEIGAAGDPGTYNWSLPETYNFVPGNYIYIAAWSDNSVAQGLLANITTPTGTLNSGNPAWQVMYTNADLNDGSIAPAGDEVQGYTIVADMLGLWDIPFVGGANGVAPWGTVPGIDDEARWMWGNPNQVADPLNGGADHGEYQIFRIAAANIPAPGSASLIAAGTLMLARRRRSTN